MDLEGVDVNLTLPSGWFGTWTLSEDPAVETMMYRAYHRWMDDYCGAFPARITGVILVSARDVACGLEEIAAWAPKRWPLGLFVYAPYGMPLDHPALEPYWKAAAEYDLGVVLHTFTVMPPYAPGGLDTWDNLWLQRSAARIGRINGIFAPPPGRTPLVLAGDHRWRRPLHAPPARRGSPPERPATPHRAAWTCRSGWGRLKPQGFPRARASGRPVVAGRGEDFNGIAQAHKGERRRRDAHVADETTPRVVGLVESEYFLAHTGRGNRRWDGRQLEMPQDTRDHRLLGDDGNNTE